MNEGRGFAKRIVQPAQRPPVAPVEGDADFMTPEYIRVRAQLFATRGQETIAPPSLGAVFYDLSDEELRERYPARYARLAEQIANVRANTPPKFAEQRELMQWFYMMNSLDRYVAARPTSETYEKALKPKQFFAVERLRHFLELVGQKSEKEGWNGEAEGFMVLPTGFGKTVMLAKIIEAMNVPPKAEASKDMREVARTRTLIVVPSLDLVPQTINQFAEFAPSLDVGAVSGKSKSRLGNHATVITYASFRNRVKDGRIKPSDFDVLILDEAHEAITTLCKEEIDKFRGNALVLGVTATDEYDPEHKNLTNMLHNKICEMSLNDAVEEGLLCDFTAEVYNTHIDVSSVSKQPDGKYSEKEWAKLVNYRQRAKVAARIYKERFAGLPLYLFCESITAANMTAAVFAEEGISSAAVTSDTSDDDHDQHWEDFNTGRVLAFASVNQFIRGNDNKKATVAMNLAPTGSQVRAQQRGGRVLRLDPLRPDKHAFVIDFLYTDRRGNPITFAQIAGREPIDITAHFSIQSQEGHADAEGDTDEHEGAAIDARDLADTDIGTVADTELIDLVTVAAERKQQEEQAQRAKIESEIFDTTVEIEHLYEQYVTNPSITDVEHIILLQIEAAVDAGDEAALMHAEAHLARMHSIAIELRDHAGLAYLFTDEGLAFGSNLPTLAEVTASLGEVQLLSFQTQLLYEEAAEIAVEYGIDIISLHEETIQAK